METQNNVCLLLSNLIGRRQQATFCWTVLLFLFNENNVFNSSCCSPCAKGWTDRLECPCKNRRLEQTCLHCTQSQAVVSALEQYCYSNFHSAFSAIYSTHNDIHMQTVFSMTCTKVPHHFSSIITIWGKQTLSFRIPTLPILKGVPFTFCQLLYHEK